MPHGHVLCVVLMIGLSAPTIAADVAIDTAGYSPDCGVHIRAEGQRLNIAWPMADGEFGRVRLDLRAERPLIAELGTSRAVDSEVEPLLRGVQPATYLTVGSRRLPTGQPPWRKWQVFFDKPADRPHETFLSRLDPRRILIESQGRRAMVTIHTLRAGSFTGALQFVFYADCRLMHVQAVVSTSEDDRAIIYDAGLIGNDSGWQRFAWMDTAGQTRHAAADETSKDQAVAVRHRTLIAETPHGSLACFPPPHQFFFPRDLTTNLRTVWFGTRHHEQTPRFGCGIRNDKEGGGAFVPWFNAPPDTIQHLGVFYLLTRGSAEDALRETLRFTHNDRFPELPGHLTFTSHWHMAVAVSAMERQARGEPPIIPDFMSIFKNMGVNLVHLAEFHGDGHQKDPGPLRLRELEAMFSECRRLSDDRLLLIPGEEVNEFLGLAEPGKHSGHWMSLFPHPVYWIMRRKADQPFVEDDPQYGRVYRVGSREDMVRLLDAEKGLVWTAHPRNKASSWTPDIFRHEDFYLADSWLGAAWKAMPADLSQPRLGQPILDLLDDMANWGQRKQLLGEVDVFKIDRTHELYGHMNVNYLRLDRLPRFDDGWPDVLAALRAGQFFTTTGEVLIRDFQLGGQQSGETLNLTQTPQPELRVELDWTFPLEFAEVISGDGQRIYRERIDMTDTAAFSRRTLTLRPQLTGRKWVRFEAWDIAANGAFTQPIWLVR